MTILKKTLLAACLMTAPASLFAQNCKFDVDKKDPFTNEHVRSVGHKIGPAGWMWQLSMEQKGSKYFLGLRIVLRGNFNESIAKGEKVMMKLENGKTVEFALDDDAAPIQNIAGSTIMTTYLTKGAVDVKMIKHLANSPITDLQVTIAGKEVALPKIKGKETSRIMDSAICMLDDAQESSK